MKVFISHSSIDKALVESLVELIKFSLHLLSSEIRCSSVDGYRLPGGARTEQALRKEVNDSETFIVVLSSQSIISPWVSFELGARWGAGKQILPILAPGISSYQLKGPLANINALSCKSRSQLHQLIHDLASQLQISPESPASYERYINHILNLSESKELSDEYKGDSQIPEVSNSDGPSKEMWEDLFSKLLDGGKKYGEQLLNQLQFVRSADLSDSRKLARLKMLFKAELDEVASSIEADKTENKQDSFITKIGLTLINRAVREKKQALEASLLILDSKDDFNNLNEMFDEVEEAIRSFTFREWFDNGT